jgi:homoserine kinase
MPDSWTVKIPATTANLGPGFDCLALALDLWNQATFTPDGKGIQVTVDGEGAAELPLDENNLVARTALYLYKKKGVQPPVGLKIHCTNGIPLGSGLGSSASAVLAGLMGANALLGNPLVFDELLYLGYELEGHPDNVSAALLGGLVIMTSQGKQILTRRIEIPPFKVVVVVPKFEFPTKAARAALPKSVPFKDAIFNVARTALVVEALRNGDIGLLSQAMEDRLHQPYRLRLIPGSNSALKAARDAGATAVGLSGAGPGLIAFTGEANARAIGKAMVSELVKAGLPAQDFILSTTLEGAKIEKRDCSKIGKQGKTDAGRP